MPKGINKAAGKESMKALAFGAANWGVDTNDYMKSVEGLKTSSWEKILQLAQVYITPKTSWASSSHVTSNDSGKDESCAMLLDLSDVEDEVNDGMLLNFLYLCFSIFF